MVQTGRTFVPGKRNRMVMFSRNLLLDASSIARPSFIMTVEFYYLCFGHGGCPPHHPVSLGCLRLVREADIEGLNILGPTFN